MYNVFNVESDYKIGSMFLDRAEFRLSNTLKNAEIVVFPGGPDVSPALYGDVPHPTTYADTARDKSFAAIYRLLSPSIVKVGICGGGQFLNVMNGGKMWQNVDNHAISGKHPLYYNWDPALTLAPPRENTYFVTSTHHQMMRPGPRAELWGWTYLSAIRDEGRDRNRASDDSPDVEVLYYPHTNTLCFQPHPEYYDDDTRRLFFKTLNRVLSARKAVKCVG